MVNIKEFKKLLKLIDDANEIIFDNLNTFNKQFCHDQAWEFLGVSFSTEYANIVYVLECGQTVSDSIEIEKVLQFIENVSCKN